MGETRGLIKAQCPKCGVIEIFKVEKTKDEILEKHGGIYTVAFYHGDHVFIVAVDSNFESRGEYVYDKAVSLKNVPVTKTVSTDAPWDQLEIILSKLKKWISFLIKTKSDTKAKIIGKMDKKEKDKLISIIKKLKDTGEKLKYDKTMVELKDGKKRIIVMYTKKDNILASIIKTGKSEDVENMRQILTNLAEKLDELTE